MLSPTYDIKSLVTLINSQIHVGNRVPTPKSQLFRIAEYVLVSLETLPQPFIILYSHEIIPILRTISDMYLDPIQNTSETARSKRRELRRRLNVLGQHCHPEFLDEAEFVKFTGNLVRVPPLQQRFFDMAIEFRHSCSGLKTESDKLYAANQALTYMKRQIKVIEDRFENQAFGNYYKAMELSDRRLYHILDDAIGWLQSAVLDSVQDPRLRETRQQLNKTAEDLLMQFRNYEHIVHLEDNRFLLIPVGIVRKL